MTDPALMGQGGIDVRRIRAWMEAAGFDGWNEVEIFSEDHRATDQNQFLDRIVQSYFEAS